MAIVNAGVESVPDEPIDSLLRRFKSAVSKCGVLTEMRSRQGYRSKSERRRDKAVKASARLRKGQKQREAAFERFSK